MLRYGEPCPTELNRPPEHSTPPRISQPLPAVDPVPLLSEMLNELLISRPCRHISESGLQEMSVTNTVDGEMVITNIIAETFGVVWTNLPAFTTNSLQGVAATGGLFIVAGEEGRVFTSSNGWNWLERTSPASSFLSGVAIGPAGCVAVDTNAVSTVYELFLFGGKPDLFFDFQSTTNLVADSWTNNASLEIFDPSGTIYAIRTRDATNTPPAEYYRTRLAP